MTDHPLLAASDLPGRWRETDAFRVLDTDFASDALFLSVWNLWLRSRGRCRRLDYVALCAPRTAPEISKPFNGGAHPLAEELSRHWPLALPGFHRVALDEGRLVLTLVFGNAAQELRLLRADCDALLVGTNAATLGAANLARLAKPGAVLASSCRDPGWIQALNKAGFETLENHLVTTGVFRTQNRRTARLSPRPLPEQERAAIVIGAGLSGTSAAAALAKRGWKVSLVERHPAPAQEASGNLAAVFSPMLSKDDGHAARLSRASFFSLKQELLALSGSEAPPLWSACGVLQLAKTPKEEQLFANIAEQHGYPAEYASFLSREEAGRDIQQTVAAGGWLFPGGGWLNPASLCRSRLAAHPGIRQLFGNGVLEIRRGDGLWQALGAGESVLAEAPVLVLANACEAERLAPRAGLRFKKVRGQVTHLTSDSLPPLHRVLSRDGYLTPPVEGVCCLGATYDFDSEIDTPREQSDLSNLERLPQLLPELNPQEVQRCGSRVGFRSLTPDRMPVVGPLACPGGSGTSAGNTLNIPSEPGLYALLGLGSRGAVWSTLAGEILACLLDGEPAPVGVDLLESIDPARFLFRHSAKSGG
jgi:tRNA 5-methylaminomethyl-2-thiouridine biosynthesis bifunctional protein